MAELTLWNFNRRTRKNIRILRRNSWTILKRRRRSLNSLIHLSCTPTRSPSLYEFARRPLVAFWRTDSWGWLLVYRSPPFCAQHPHTVVQVFPTCFCVFQIACNMSYFVHCLLLVNILIAPSAFLFSSAIILRSASAASRSSWPSWAWLRKSSVSIRMASFEEITFSAWTDLLPSLYTISRFTYRWAPSSPFQYATPRFLLDETHDNDNDDGDNNIDNDEDDDGVREKTRLWLRQTTTARKSIAWW